MKIYVTLLSLFIVAQVQGSPDPKKIMKKNISSGLVDTLYAKRVHLEGKTKSGKRKKKVYKMWRKRIGETRLSKIMSRFILPQKIKGQGVLLIEQGTKKGGDQIMLYLPAYKRVRRIERHMQNGSFMGTAFSYSDMIAPELDNYHYTYKKLVNCPITPSVKCHVVLSKPKTREIRERKGYAYYLTWVRSDNFMSEKVEGFNENKKKIKILTFENIEKIGKRRWLTRKITAKDLKSKRWAVFEIKEYESGVNVDDSYFTENFLKNP